MTDLCALCYCSISQNEYKKWEAKECEKQKKVNLNAGAWTDNPDKYLLELAGTYQDYGHHGKWANSSNNDSFYTLLVLFYVLCSIYFEF